MSKGNTDSFIHCSHSCNNLQGIGKSETAYQLASALFDTFPGSRNPCGLLTIMGGDFSEQSLHYSKGGLLEVRIYITNFWHIFDEYMDKML